GATDQEIATLTIGNPSLFLTTHSYLAVSRTTGRVFVADYNNGTVTVVDGATNAIVATLHVGRGPTSIALNEALNRIYVGNALDKSLTIIDGNTLRVAAVVLLPLSPVRLEVDEGASLVVAYALNTETRVMIISAPGTSAPRGRSV